MQEGDSREPFGEAEELSGVVINSSGDLQPDPQIKIEQRRRFVSIMTIALALVNIGLEAVLQILETLGKIEQRGAVLSTVGFVLVAVCFFTIPFRKRWTVIANRDSWLVLRLHIVPASALTIKFRNRE